MTKLNNFKIEIGTFKNNPVLIFKSIDFSYKDFAYGKNKLKIIFNRMMELFDSFDHTDTVIIEYGKGYSFELKQYQFDGICDNFDIVKSFIAEIELVDKRIENLETRLRTANLTIQKLVKQLKEKEKKEIGINIIDVGNLYKNVDENKGN